jgi:hypothetical protein
MALPRGSDVITTEKLYAFFAIALLTVAGCDRSRTPALPTAPAAPGLAPVVPQGHIAVLSVRPESGATLTAEPCDGGYCISDTDVRLTFQVQLDRDVNEPWVTVSFDDGMQRCAGSGYPNIIQTIEPLRANTATTFSVTFLALSDHLGLLCPLPHNTTTMVVQLWPNRGRSPVALLTGEFPHSYTFVLP